MHKYIKKKVMLQFNADHKLITLYGSLVVVALYIFCYLMLCGMNICCGIRKKIKGVRDHAPVV